MGITLTIELERLAEPAVSEAFTNLVSALGKLNPAAATGLRRAFGAPAEPTHSTRAERPLAPAPKPVVERAPAPPPAPIQDHRDPEERYTDFVASLPERSREFLELVKGRGIVTIDVAMEKLGVTVPKGMGGITGSIARWAPERGVAIPYEAIKVGGRRAWRWIGDGAESTPPAPAAEELLEPVSEVLPGNAQERYAAFVDGLPERTQRFLELVEARGTLSRVDAIEALGLSSGKQLGGVTGAIGKWAPRRGVQIPYETTTVEGERAWRWVGIADDEATDDVVAEVVEVKAAPAPKPAAAPEPTDSVEALFEELPDDATEFLRLLQTAGSLPMPVVTKHFQLPRAVSVGRIIEPIKRRAKELGMELPFTKDRAPEGYSVYLWQPPAKPEALKMAANGGPVAADEPAVAGGRAHPGVRVRRRSGG